MCVCVFVRCYLIYSGDSLDMSRSHQRMWGDTGRKIVSRNAGIESENYRPQATSSFVVVDGLTYSSFSLPLSEASAEPPCDWIQRHVHTSYRQHTAAVYELLFEAHQKTTDGSIYDAVGQKTRQVW